MADLQLAPARERSVVPALLVALFVLSAVGAAVFWFNPHKVADLQVTAVQPFAPHTETKAIASSSMAGGMRVLNQGSATGEDNLYLVATVKFTDRLRIPVYLTGVVAHVTFADGTEVQARMVSTLQLQRLEQIFPEITPLIINPIADDDEVDPGVTRVGTVVLPFPARNADAWKTKRAATLSLALRNQEPQTARLP